MPELGNKPPPFREGSSQISAEALNYLRQLGLRQIRGSENASVSDYGDRVSVVSRHTQAQLPETANYVMQMVVVEDEDDFILCVPFILPAEDKTTSDARWVPQKYDSNLEQDNDFPVRVAKPYILQKTPWNNKTVTLNGQVVSLGFPVGGNVGTRTATIAGQAVQEQITPSYFPGDLIQAVRTPTGYIDTKYNVPVVWMDLNSAGRVWTPIVGGGGVVALLNADSRRLVTWAGLNIAGNTSPNGSSGPIVWGASRIGAGNQYFNLATPTRILVPKAGVYEINCEVACGNFDTTMFAAMAIASNLNGVIFSDSFMQVSAMFNTGTGVSVTAQFPIGIEPGNRTYGTLKARGLVALSIGEFLTTTLLISGRGPAGGPLFSSVSPTASHFDIEFKGQGVM